MLDVAAVWTPPIQQKNFRALLEAMSRPGSIHRLHGTDSDCDSPLAILATLLDSEVTFNDHNQLLSADDYLRLQATTCTAEEADFLLCAGHQQPSVQPALGTLCSPECSATLVLQVNSVTEGDTAIKLRGPGIKEEIECYLSGLHPQWLASRQEWVSAFPLGVDMIFADKSRIMALPRTSMLEVI